MIRNLGFYNTSSTRTHVRFQFTTHAAAGGNVAPLTAFEAADIRIYKAADGAAFSATQRSSSNGITMTSPFDSLTGVHDVDIDLTDNTDAGFYASGCRYSIVLAPDTETVDSQTITGVVLGEFEIGVAKADVTQLLGTAWLTPGTAGTPDVNAKLIGGTAQTGRDIGTSVLLSSGTGTGQLDFTSGVVKSNLVQILATALTETSGLLAAGFKKFFNVATPTGTVNSLPDAVPGAANALLINGSNTGPMSISGGVTFSNSGGDALALTSSGGNGNGLNLTANGSGSGLLATAGATGHGGKFVGGSSSGNGIDLGVTSGHGLNSVASGTSKNGINALGSSTSGNGVLFTGRGTGHGLSAVSGSGATGDGINATAASTNGNGFAGYGTGTGDGAMFTGGLTGRGVHLVGGGTSGDGCFVETTSGHGINLAPVGTNKHGLFATGGNGGTSDGIKAAAGTGGVDIRGNITGNIVGTLSTLTTYTGNTPQTGDAYAYLGTNVGLLGANLTAADDAVITAIGALNNLSQANVRTAVGLANANLDTQLSTIAGYIDTEVATLITSVGAGLNAAVLAVKAKTDNLPSDPADQSLVEAAITAAWTTAMTESYNADGAAPTPAQALFAILQRLTEFAITSTTISVKKLDGTTEAFTLTLDSATSPTSSTRAT